MSPLRPTHIAVNSNIYSNGEVLTGSVRKIMMFTIEIANKTVRYSYAVPSFDRSDEVYQAKKHKNKILEMFVRPITLRGQWYEPTISVYSFVKTRSGISSFCY